MKYVFISITFLFSLTVFSSENHGGSHGGGGVTGTRSEIFGSVPAVPVNHVDLKDAGSGISGNGGGTST